VLAFPCNQFGGQEPGTHEEIIEFVKKIDEHIPEKVTFFEKSDVNGANARESFSFLKQACPNDDGSTDIRWNFGKFKIGLQLCLFVPCYMT
jgi:glutathione peroxidase